MQIVRNIRRETFLLVILCIAAFFVNNSALPPDGGEVKNLITAREIVNGGQWLLPTMNGVTRLDKPPLAAWLAALVETVYPDNISAQRCMPAVAGVMLAMFFFGVARYMERRRGFAELATMVFVTCYNVIFLGRTVSRDIYCYAFMMGGLYFLFRLMFDERYYAHPHKWRWAVLSGLMMGLSFLSNGTMAFYSMLLPVVLVIVSLRRPVMRGKWMPLVLLILLCLLTFGWWYVYLFSCHSDALLDALRNERNAWLSGHIRPWYYYWRFFLEMGIWAVLILAALVVPYWSKRVSTRRLYYIAMSWLVIALVLLSIVPDKNMTNLMSLVPPCALIVACVLYYYIERRPCDKWARWLFKFNGYLIALIIFALPFFVYIRLAKWGILDFGTALFVSFFLFAVAVYVFVSTNRRDTLGIVRGVLVLFFIAECFLLGAVGGLFGNRHLKSISLLQKDTVLASIPIYHTLDNEPQMKVVYQAKKKILPLDVADAGSVGKTLPCLVISKGNLAQLISPQLMEEVDTLYVGVFDDNVFPKSNKHYSSSYVNHITLLKPKNTSASRQ